MYRVKDTNTFVSFDQRKDYKTTRLHVDINFVDNDILDIESFKNWREEYMQIFLNDQGKYICGYEVEKMSKSKYNVQSPDDLVKNLGIDAFDYEMFLGPLEHLNLGIQKE